MNIKESEFSEFDWQGYKKQIENTLKVNKMAVLNNTLTLNWIDEQLKKFEQKKTNEKNTKKQD